MTTTEKLHEQHKRKKLRGTAPSRLVFENRDAYLEHELEILNPKRWKINLPLRDYRFEWEDLIPAMAGTIGKVVMVGAVAAAFAVPLGLPDGFVLET